MIVDSFVKVYSQKIQKLDIKDPVLFNHPNYQFLIMDKQDITRGVRPMCNDKIIIIDEIFQLNKNYWSLDVIVYPFPNFVNVDISKTLFDNDSTNFYILTYFNNNNRFKSSCVIIKLSSDCTSIDYYISKLCIRNIMQNKKEQKEHIVKKVFEKIKMMDIINKCDTELKSILNNTAINNENTENNYQHLLKDSFKLYKYQINDINWLNDIKNKVDKNENVITYDYSPSVNFDFYKKEDVLPTIYYQNRFIGGLKSENVTNSFKFKGGNLISSMGLGKTIVMLCFLLKDSNVLFNQFIKNVERLNCNYFYKRGEKKGTHCDKIINKTKSTLFCTDHRKTPFIDKKVCEYKNLEFFELNDYISFVGNRTFYKTNSNIIICPTHLCDQWIKEYYNSFIADRRILLIVTNDQYNNLTFGDILFSDLIIVSYNFLLNNQYNNNSSLDLKKYKNKNLTIDKKIELLSSKNFILSDFLFVSKSMDECHEIISKSKNVQLEITLSKIQSMYTWNISGTPFANGVEGFLHNLSYISDISYSIRNKMDRWNLSDFLCNGINENIIEKSSHLFRRNTTESIKNEYSGNIINNTLTSLTFTEPERNIYNSYLKGHPDKNYNFLIKLCCDPEINQETQHLIQNCKSLEEIQSVLLDHNFTKLNSSTKKIKQIEVQIEYLQNELEQIGINSEEATDYKVEIGNNRRNLTLERKNYDTIKRTYDYLKSVVDNLVVSEICPICLDDTIQDNLAITKCGHKFCWDCINEYLEETGKTHNTKCPKCNIFIKLNEIFFFKEKDKVDLIETSTTNTELAELIKSTKSTKIGNIIYYLKNELSENNKNKTKIIIFSQWDQLLDKINFLLSKYKIKTTTVKGSVYQRKNAIDIFTNLSSDTNIILLSSKNAASGINLTIANKIILVEPVYGTIEYRKDIENQAIGRCDRINQTRPIEVIRYIISDTIEEKIYNSGTQDFSDELELDVLELDVLEL